MIHHGDCIEVMRTMPDSSVDSIVTDPPYGLGFMGKAWDELPPGEEWARECLRVLKPGGYLLAFGGTRTWHRLAVAVEDAGFEIRDSIAWMYGSGFPKSLDVSKAIDKAAGAERVVTATERSPFRMADPKMGNVLESTQSGDSRSVDSDGYIVRNITAPATPDAERWQGWGTALKPAFEPVVVARKPLVGTVAANVLAHGTGALNVDGCRVEGAPRTTHADGNRVGDRSAASTTLYTKEGATYAGAAGRWPANVVLDESQAEALDEQSGVLKAPRSNGSKTQLGHAGTDTFKIHAREQVPGRADDGGASRFFYIAREDNESCLNHDHANTAGPTTPPPSASGGSAPSDAATSAHPATARLTGSPSISGTPSASRPSGASDTPMPPTTGAKSLPELPLLKPFPSGNRASSAEPSELIDTTTTTTNPSTSDGSADPATSSTTQPLRAPGELDSLDARFRYVAKAPRKERPVVDGVAHATVKPLALMRWLVRLVTPPGGTVLDPFAGSGTTIEAALLEGFQPIGIEREADYLPLIEARIERASEQLGLFGGAA